MKNKYEARVAETETIVDGKLDKLIDHANALAKAMNAVPGEEGSMTTSEIDKAKKELKELKDSYNASAEELAYLQWANEAETPQECMETAIRAMHIPRIKNATVRLEKKIGAYVAKVEDARPAPTNRINLIHMKKTLGVEYFARENWFDYVQAIAICFVNHITKEMGVATYSYETSIAETFSFGEKADPSSKNSMIKALQETVDAILFIPMTKKNGDVVNSIKIDGRDYSYLKEAFTKEGKDVAEIAVKDTQNTARLIAQIINVKLEGKSYTLSVG